MSDATDAPTGLEGLTVTVNDDGSVDFAKPYIKKSRDESAGGKFGQNLAEILDVTALGVISQEVIEGVEADMMSRSGFVENYNRGIDLLALKIENPSNTKGPQRSISRAKHPALLEATVRYQAGARNEMLPAAGPVKAMTIGDSTPGEDQLANDFEADFNYFLTDIAKEYYPDTDAGLFLQGYGGNMIKKVYHSPTKRRPVSEVVPIEHFIVNESATSLDTALRVTHESPLSRGMVKRMMLSGAWRDIGIASPQMQFNPIAQKVKETEGLAAMTSRPLDMLHTFWETDLELDLAEWGLVERAPEGLPLPYTVTVEKDSREIVALRRNWKDDDEEFQKRPKYVKFGMIPGMGFLDYGFLHLIGNQTRVLTGILQLLVDSGMLGNFPGGMRVKGVRSQTNEITPGLGEFVELDIGPVDDIRKAIMAMPYHEPGAGLIQVYQMMEQNVQRMAGTVELELGEGRTNIPVGTILSMIEQQTQVMSAVHKRNHTAQKQELMILRDLFVEDPQALTKLARNPARVWETGMEFSALDISPASDPNVPSAVHRLMQATTLEMMAGTDPVNIDRREVHRRTFRDMHIADPESLMIQNPQPPQQQQPPQQGNPAAAQASIAKAQMELPIKQMQAQTDAAKLQLDQQMQQREAAEALTEAQQREDDRQTDIQIAQDKLQMEKERLAMQERQHGITAALQLHADHQDRQADMTKHFSGLAAAANQPVPKPAPKKGKQDGG